MKRIFYTADVITPDGSDTSFDGDGTFPGEGTTRTHGYVSPDRSMVQVWENQEQVAPDVFEPDPDDEDDEQDPAAWLAERLGHYERLYEVETDNVNLRDLSSVAIYSRYQHEIDHTGVKVTLAALVEGFTAEEIERAIALIKSH